MTGHEANGRSEDERRRRGGCPRVVLRIVAVLLWLDLLWIVVVLYTGGTAPPPTRDWAVRAVVLSEESWFTLRESEWFRREAESDELLELADDHLRWSQRFESSRMSREYDETVELQARAAIASAEAGNPWPIADHSKRMLRSIHWIYTGNGGEGLTPEGSQPAADGRPAETASQVARADLERLQAGWTRDRGLIAWARRSGFENEAGRLQRELMDRADRRARAVVGVGASIGGLFLIAVFALVRSARRSEAGSSSMVSSRLGLGAGTDLFVCSRLAYVLLAGFGAWIMPGLFGVVGEALAALLVVAACTVLLKGDGAERVGLGTFRPGTVISEGAAAFALLAPAVLAQAVYFPIDVVENAAGNYLVQVEGPMTLALLFASMAGTIPFIEELLFRGMLYAGLRSRLSPAAAAFLSSSLFAVLHGRDLVPTLVLLWGGLVLCRAYERSGSLWSGVLAHSLWNASIVAFAAALALGN